MKKKYATARQRCRAGQNLYSAIREQRKAITLLTRLNTEILDTYCNQCLETALSQLETVLSWMLDSRVDVAQKNKSEVL